MTTRTLEKKEWKSYFDFVSKSLVDKGVDIELLGQNMGAQKEGKVSRMFGVTYDPNDNIVEVATETLDHIVSDPTLIRVEEEGALLKTIEVTQNDGLRQIIKIIQPLALPAA